MPQNSRFTEGRDNSVVETSLYELGGSGFLNPERVTEFLFSTNFQTSSEGNGTVSWR